MSFNRIDYDPAEYYLKLKQSTTTLGYVLDTMPFENINKKFHQLGLVGGPTVSHIRGNIIDLESDLRGQTRLYSWCPSSVADPMTKAGVIHNDKTEPIDTRKLNLPTFQMIGYKSVPLPN